MINLFLDSSFYLTLGLLDSEWQWLDYQQWCTPKSSSSIHYQLDLLLKKHSLTIDSIDRVLYIAGPGSYTGMRIAHGVAQCFELLDKPIYSVYHFQIPYILGVQTGVWFASAFKGEYFLYQWEGANQEQHLLNGPTLKSTLERAGQNQLPIFSYFDAPQSFSAFLPEPLTIQDSAQLIHLHAGDLFKDVLQKKLQLPAFYYRSLTEEFKTIDGR